MKRRARTGHRVVEAAKDGHTRSENCHTQPLRSHRVFGNPEVLSEGWYPLCPGKEVAPGEARSLRVGWQRLVVWRGEDGRARALDAFCPHMGADLGNGRVVDNHIECYFHQWCYSDTGRLVRIRCASDPPGNVHTRPWPVEEKYGWLWAWAGPSPHHPLPDPPGMEGQPMVAWHLASPLLYAHHHVMMAGGIDLQHFASVHNLDISFHLEVHEGEDGVADWRLQGEIPRKGWRARLGRWLLGDRFAYHARFAGGSVVTLTYGPGQRFRGKGRLLPPLHILWGSLPQESGVSRVLVFLLTPRRPGVSGWLGARVLLGLTAVLLTVLRDDDIRAFPHMRFSPGTLIHQDQSVASFIRYINTLSISPWSKNLPEDP